MRFLGLFHYTKPEPEIVHSIVVFDLPNVRNLSPDEQKELGVHYRPVDWKPLIEQIKGDLKDTVLEHAGAYATTDPDGTWFKSAVYSWAEVGVRLEPRLAKDIDRLICDDVWNTVFRLYDAVRSARKKKLRIRCILVSGDGDYVDTFSKIRRRLQGFGTFDLRVYTFKKRLSSSLGNFAGYANVRYLERIKDFEKLSTRQ